MSIGTFRHKCPNFEECGKYIENYDPHHTDYCSRVCKVNHQFKKRQQDSKYYKK